MNRCFLLTGTRKRISWTRSTTNTVLLSAVAVFSENSWIKPTYYSAFPSLFSIHTLRCHETLSQPSYLPVTCSNVLHTKNYGGSSWQIVIPLRKEQNIIFSANFSILLTKLSHVLHVYCATAVVLCDTTSYQYYTKSITLHKLSFIFSGDSFAVCKSFDRR